MEKDSIIHELRCKFCINLLHQLALSGCPSREGRPGEKSYLEFSPVCQKQPDGSGLYNKVLTPQK